MLAVDGRPAASEALRGHAIRHRDLAADLAPGLPPEAAARVAAALAEVTAVTDAPAAMLPAVLADPPWLRPRVVRAPVVVDGLRCLDPPSVEWLPGERDRWLSVGQHETWYMPSAKWPEEAERISAGNTRWYDGPGFFRHAPDELTLPLIGRWRPSEAWDAAEWMPQLAARYELAALPALLHLAGKNPSGSVRALLPYAAPELAVQMAEWFSRLKSVRGAALSWLVRHAESAARALVPVALSKPGPQRRYAERALSALAAAGRDDEIRAAAGGYGATATGAVDALLATDPLEALPARVPAVPAWADAAVLPRIRLRVGAAVPIPAATHVVTMLAMSRMGDPYAGLDQVRTACEPADLAAFVWSLFQTWQSVGSPSKDNWVLDALGLLGDDDTVRRLAPVIRAWPGEGGHARAVTGLDVLATIGTEVALMHLNGIAQKVKFKGLRERAIEKIEEVASALGLTSEQLADRLVPDFGLDPAGSLVLDYGPRRFTVGFDEQLKPFVVDGDGKRRKDLPKPGSSDDPELAPAAHQRFAALKKDVRTVAGDQILRLERAMVVRRRRWSAAEFRDLFVAHPLLWHVVRRLVWLVHDENGAVTGALRVAEDRTFADENDDTVTLPDTAAVSVAHPLQLGASLTAWSELFADYAILQPFPQLGREVFAPTADERDGNLVRFAGRKVPTVRLLGLERRGWERESPQDAGWQGYLRLTLPDGTTATLAMDPGTIVGDHSFAPDQKVESVSISPPPGGTLDPLVISEVIRDVEAVTT
jgi:hypothetical protein